MECTSLAKLWERTMMLRVGTALLNRHAKRGNLWHASSSGVRWEDAKKTTKAVQASTRKATCQAGQNILLENCQQRNCYPGVHILSGEIWNRMNRYIQLSYINTLDFNVIAIYNSDIVLHEYTWFYFGYIVMICIYIV